MSAGPSEPSILPTDAVIVHIKAEFFWKSQVMKQRGDGEVVGRIQKKVTSVCTYYAPDTAYTQWPSPAFCTQGDERLVNVPEVIQLSDGRPKV